MSKKRSKSAQAKSPQANPVQAKSDRTKATPKATHRPGAGCAIAAVGLILVLLAGAAVGTPWLLTVLANGAETPTLTAGAAHELLVEQQRQAKTQLESYGWVDKEAAVAHVPIERAITMLANSELPVGVAAAIPPTAPPAAADLTNVNYTDNILPIFQQHCAECHGNDDPEEGLTLTNYKAAMAGSIYGKVIIPGDPDKSYLVEMVSTGQMPKKGPDLTPEEIATIIAWINAGAPEAGSAIANSAPISGTVSMSDTAATGDGGQSITPETVSFADNVLPIFQDRCAECHGDNDPEEGLVLTSYKDVMLGSIYGAVVKPGDPDGSYLVEMVSTGQMPKKGADLTQSQIATIVAWINAGAPDN